MLLAPVPASAAWLALCDAETPLPDTRVLGVYPDPQGHGRRLVISDHAPEGCDALSIAVTAEDIRWAGLITTDDAAGMETGVSLLGDESSGRDPDQRNHPRPAATHTDQTRPAGAAG